MGQRISVDPITRIEGHLKIDVEIENGVVKDAWSSGTMARGFEALLTGKDPRDASYVTSRFCGVCFSVHTMASAACLDDAETMLQWARLAVEAAQRAPAPRRKR